MYTAMKEMDGPGYTRGTGKLYTDPGARKATSLTH